MRQCARVAQRVRNKPAGAWVTGAGWGSEWLARPAISIATTSRCRIQPEHPVALTHTSGHCTWVDTVALRLAGVNRETQAPVGGAIDVDDAGEPTGILRDRASDLVTSAIPSPSQTDRHRRRRGGGAHTRTASGLTTVHAMNVGRGEFQALHALNDSGRLKLRVRMYLSHDRLDEWIERAITHRRRR